MKPIIFLDVDGVLNCSKDWDIFKPLTSSGTILDPEKINRVLKLQKQFDAEIVLSSTWRMYPDACKALNMSGLFWERTTNQSKLSSERAHEINEFLITLSEPVNFVILDDDSSPQDVPELKEHQVLTEFREGFQDHHLKSAQTILSRSNHGSH